MSLPLSAFYLTLTSCITEDDSFGDIAFSENNANANNTTDTDNSSDSATDSASEPSTEETMCSDAEPTIADTMMIGDKERRLLLRLPQSYDGTQTFPLIFALHGLGGTGTLANVYFGLNQSAGDEAIIVYPTALSREEDNGETGWELDPTGYDFDFFDALYAMLVSELCVDTNRVYVTGHSYGGYMSNQIGCHRGDLLAGIAPVASGGPFAECTTPVPALIIHGSNDDVVAYSQGTESLTQWLELNSCEENEIQSDDSNCVTYEGCSENVLWCSHQGAHEWPEFAAESIWAFFASQTRSD